MAVPAIVAAAVALLPLFSRFAPSLGRLLAGPDGEAIATRVVNVAHAAAGSTEPQDVAQALGDPVKSAELMLAVTKIEAEAEAERMKALLADVQDARGYNTKLVAMNSKMAWGPAITSVVCIGLFAAIILFRLEVDMDMKEIVKTLAIASASYWIGSSNGSKRSGDAVREIAVQRGGGATTAVATTGNVQVGDPNESAEALNNRMGGYRPGS